MRKLLLSGAALCVFAAPALAADLPVAPIEPVFVPAVAAFSWTGLYVGVHGGYAFGNDDDEILEFDFDGDGDFDDTILTGAGADAFGPGFESDIDGGFDLGARIGYDVQFGSFLVGALADISFTDIESEITGFSTTPAFYTFERDLEWFGTLRARAGVAFDRFLVYGTGGLAYGNVDREFSSDTPAGIDDVRSDDDDFGYTVGAGVEALVTDRLSLGLEYLYTDLGEDDFEVTLSGPGAPLGPFGAGTDVRTTDDDFDFHTIRAVVNYRFGGMGF